MMAEIAVDLMSIHSCAQNVNALKEVVEVEDAVELHQLLDGQAR